MLVIISPRSLKCIMSKGNRESWRQWWSIRHSKPVTCLACASVYHVSDPCFSLKWPYMLNAKCLTASFHLILITVLENMNLSALYRWGLRGGVREIKSILFDSKVPLSGIRNIQLLLLLPLLQPKLCENPKTVAVGSQMSACQALLPCPTATPRPCHLTQTTFGKPLKVPRSSAA